MINSNIWKPINEDDFGFDDFIDPLDLIRNNVFKRNESWDIQVLGFKGNGKSTVGLGLCLELNPKLKKMNPRKALEKCWTFTTKDRELKKKKLNRGDVLCTDEQGTKESGSSYEWFQEVNKHFADTRQLDRTDGVIEIGITLDEMRLIKRVRNVYRVIIHPDNKLTSEQNNNHGLGIDCIVREVVENPFARSESDRYRYKYFNYSNSGRIPRLVIPHPPDKMWNAYTEMRQEFKEMLDNQEPAELQHTDQTYYEEVSKKQKIAQGVM